MSTEPKPESPAELAAERERFEAWMLTQGYEMIPRICSAGSPSEGEYANSFWQAHWDVWRAALATVQASDDDFLREMTEARDHWKARRDFYRTRCKELEASLAEIQAPGSASQEPVAWCELTPSGQIAYFDGKPMIMPGPVGNDCHTTPLYTAATQARPASGEAWQPIETAPKEPGVYLLLATAAWVCEGWWDDSTDSWWERNNHETDAWGAQIYPTHWMPLPAAPTSTPSAAKKD